MQQAGLGKRIFSNWRLYVLVLPAIVYLIIFNYLPMYGIQIAFKDYKAVRGIAGSAWVGFKHFQTFFNSYYSGRLISNTFLLNVLALVCSLKHCVVGFALAMTVSIITTGSAGTCSRPATGGVWCLTHRHNQLDDDTLAEALLSVFPCAGKTRSGV